MPGNSKRRGAVRKAGTKKGAQVGSGGQRRRGLRGKGPTPKAEDRPYHPAAKRKAAAEKSGNRRPSRRVEAGQDVIGGRNSVLEALRADIPATTLYLATGLSADERTEEVQELAAQLDIGIREVSKSDLDELTDGAVHQGVGLAVPPYEYAEPQDLLAGDGTAPPLIVALDSVTDPRNLGATLRSAGAFGADGVVIPQRRSAGVTPSAWKVSAGAAARVPVARATNLVRALQDYQKAGCFVVGLAGDADTSIGELNLATEPLVLVLGSEGKGLGRLVREQCDLVVTIPIASAVESLNAATAIGIALYEVDRLRQAGTGGA